MKIKNNKGYSLVELLGVMVIIGILFSVGIMNYGKYRLKTANDAYKMMSQNAATAAEDYFLDNRIKKEVEVKTLVEEEYLEDTIDPLYKKEQCGGKVVKIDSTKTKNGKLGEDILQVKIECKKHKSCNIYPGNLECSTTGEGIITNGSTTYYNMGLENEDFGNNMSLVIRLKFNNFNNHYMEYFGNWEQAGGGLGLKENSHNFYFNLYSNTKNDYCEFASNEYAVTDHWYIVVGILDNEKLKMYLDGNQLTTADGKTEVDLPGGVKPSPYPIIVGGNPQGENPLLAPVPITVSNALVFNRALTPTEINNYFSQPKAPINYTNTDALVNKKFE